MKKAKNLTNGALLAALYTALCYLQNILIPGSASWAIQFRAAEALCVLSLFTPAAIPGLTIGCLLFNLSFSGALPLDPILGTGATLLSTAAMYFTRKLTVKGYPFLALLMPVIFNAVIIGLEIEIFFIEGAFTFTGFVVQAALVGLGELIACVGLGIPLYLVLNKLNVFNKFNT